LEATRNTLHKVKISGGGRCNVLHDPRKGVATLLAGYPRGARELSGLYHKHFTPDDAHEWFVSRGVALKVEPDGRCFPVTDSSQTIMNTLLDAAHHADVHIRLQHKVSNITRIEKDDDDHSVTATEGLHRPQFRMEYKDGTHDEVHTVILATGSAHGGYELAHALGHTTSIPRVPSLFTLRCKPAVTAVTVPIVEKTPPVGSVAAAPAGILHGLSGISVPHGRITLQLIDDTEQEATREEAMISTAKDKTEDTTEDGIRKKRKRKKKKKQQPQEFVQDGPILITHQGVYKVLFFCCL